MKSLFRRRRRSTISSARLVAGSRKEILRSSVASVESGDVASCIRYEATVVSRARFDLFHFVRSRIPPSVERSRAKRGGNCDELRVTSLSTRVCRVTYRWLHTRVYPPAPNANNILFVCSNERALHLAPRFDFLEAFKRAAYTVTAQQISRSD